MNLMNIHDNLRREYSILAIIFIFKYSKKPSLSLSYKPLLNIHSTTDIENQFPTPWKTHWSCDQFQICWPFEIFLVNPKQYAKKKNQNTVATKFKCFRFRVQRVQLKLQSIKNNYQKWLVSMMDWLKRDRILIRIIKHINHTVGTIKIIMVVITTIHLEDLIRMEEDLKVQELRLKTA